MLAVFNLLYIADLPCPEQGGIASSIACKNSVTPTASDFIV